MKKLTFLFLIIFLPLMASADVININDIYYDLDFSTKTAEVTSNPNKYTGNVDIPASVTFKGAEYRVTFISGAAFSDCNDLISVTIPNSVTAIGGETFRYCSGLTSVTIPNSVTAIGGLAFDGCSGLTSISIPSSVTSIGYGAFSNCSGLTSVHITDLESWCKISFSHYYSNPLSYANHLYINEEEIKDLVIPNSVTSIGNYAFYGYSSLVSVTIPNSVKYLGERAFYGCSGLTSITIPNSVTSIGSSAFSSCSGLTSVTIPNSVTYIGNSAFDGCSGLESLSVESGNSNYDSRGNCNAIIETAKNNLIIGCNNTTIPNSVTSIGSKAFSNCLGLTSVSIPNSVESIAYGAFSGCSNLTSVIIPYSVTSISDYAFSGCISLADVYCYAENVPTTSSYAFSDGKTSYIKNATLHVPEVSIIDYQNTAPWKGFGTIVGVKYTIDGIYYSLNFNKMQAMVTSGDTEYTGSIVIPSSITFNDTEYEVTCIGDSAFYSCSGLTSVSIPNSVTSIGNAAFANCMELAEVYCYAEQVPTTDSDVFKDSYINYVTLYVPTVSIYAYKGIAPWKGFGSIVTLPEPVLHGDVNEDGVVNGTDIQAVINFIVESQYDEKADVNKDDIVNGTDIQEVINIIVNAE